MRNDEGVKARGIFCLFFTVLFVDWWKMSSLPHTMVDPIFEVSLLEITKNWLCPSVLMPHHAKISSCSSKCPRVTSQDSSDRSHSFDFNQINHLCCLAVETFPKSLEGVYYFISYTANILDVILLIKSDFFEAIRLISKVSSQFMAYLSARSRTDQP